MSEERIMREFSATDGWQKNKPDFHDPVDAQTLSLASEIVEDVRTQGELALREHAERLGDVESGAPMILGQEQLGRAKTEIAPEDLQLLERCAARIRNFAQAQRDSIRDCEITIPGGRAGHRLAPVEAAGCYAPGGRFPLPSSVLMTAVTAKVAGVEKVWVASPRPTKITQAAAAVAGADALLCVGGAQAIAALTYGAGEIPACDAIVGPGNRWVTAAKQLVAGRVAIDMLAGPSELVVLADESAKASWVAADLLAQAEHDPDALPVLVSLSSKLSSEVQRELEKQLQDLPTAETARAAIKNGYIVNCDSVAQALAICDQLAPEHLELSVADPKSIEDKLQHYGGLFVGEGSAEVFGDYGAGPNHVLPTGRTARFTGGLSVFNFLRIRTYMNLDASDGSKDQLIQDSARLARLEGLEAHARAAQIRAKNK